MSACVEPACLTNEARRSAAPPKVSKLLIQQCTGAVKKESLELGGNVTFIVFDGAGYRDGGQRAIASRHSKYRPCLRPRQPHLADRIVRAMKVAGEFGPSAVIKPLIEMRVVGKVEAHIADAVKKGAKIVLSTRWAARSASRPVSVDATNVGLLAALLPF